MALSLLSYYNFQETLPLVSVWPSMPLECWQKKNVAVATLML